MHNKENNIQNERSAKFFFCFMECFNFIQIIGCNLTFVFQNKMDKNEKKTISVEITKTLNNKENSPQKKHGLAQFVHRIRFRRIMQFK